MAKFICRDGFYLQFSISNTWNLYIYLGLRFFGGVKEVVEWGKIWSQVSTKLLSLCLKCLHPFVYTVHVKDDLEGDWNDSCLFL